MKLTTKEDLTAYKELLSENEKLKKKS